MKETAYSRSYSVCVVGYSCVMWSHRITALSHSKCGNWQYLHSKYQYNFITAKFLPFHWCGSPGCHIYIGEKHRSRHEFYPECPGVVARGGGLLLCGIALRLLRHIACNPSNHQRKQKPIVRLTRILYNRLTVPYIDTVRIYRRRESNRNSVKAETYWSRK